MKSRPGEARTTVSLDAFILWTTGRQEGNLGPTPPRLKPSHAPATPGILRIALRQAHRAPTT